MKAITTTLYVCGALMIVATVMGAIDYSAAQKKGVIKNLYKEEKPVVVEPNKTAIDYEDYSRGEINRPEPKKQAKSAAKTEKKMIEKETIALKTIDVDSMETITEEKVEKPVANKKNQLLKKKTISLKRFSRGPLREEIIEEKPVIDTAEKKVWEY